jgi:hypothetical protein
VQPIQKKKSQDNKLKKRNFKEDTGDASCDNVMQKA